MSDIKIEIDIDEANLILEALGQLPFVRVYRLIGRIQAQAAAQVQASQAAAETEQAPQ